MAKTFFISDLHLGHTNALRFDNRPFSTIEEHDEEIINRWNKTVSHDDQVYILGDVSWHGAETTISILKRLNGGKHLITGNHDHDLLKNKDFCEMFCEITDYKEIRIGASKSDLVLCHYPILCFNKHYYGAYHFYGHVHNSAEFTFIESARIELEDKLKKPCKAINVGCMMPYMDYTPRTFEAIVTGVKNTDGLLSNLRELCA